MTITRRVTFDSHVVIPSILDKPPVDVERELMPVLLIGTAPCVIAAGAGRLYKSFADATAAQRKETQHMTLLLQDGPAFKTFFDKQVATWARW